MLGGSQLGQLIGRRFGSYLGRQLALGACRDDRDDDLERRPFTPRIASAQLPPAVDLRPWTTPVEDQGQLGSCAANALVGGLEYLVRRETGQHEDLSRLFVYFCQRLWDGSVRDDLGASMADGVRVLSRMGAPTERTWPYHRDLFAVQPPEPVLREAAATRVVDWWSVPVDADAFRGCLAAGFPIAFGTRVTESFVATPRSGECGMPSGTLDRRHGRHALLAVGYDDARRVFVVRNSWGADWGDGGHVYMPYTYVLHPGWTSGCWALRLTARDAFDPAEHAIDLRTAPKAPPAGSSGGGAAAAGTVASMGASFAVGAFTGSGLLAGLAGGLVSGLTPGVSKALQGRDNGAFLDADRSEAILRAMRGSGAPAPSLARFPWDDGLDEDAAVTEVGPSTAQRPVRASGRIGASSAPTSPAAVAGAAVAGAAVAPAVIEPVPEKSTPPAVVPAAVRGTPVIEEDVLRRIDALPEIVAARWRREGGRMSPLGPPLAEATAMVEGAYRGVVARFQDGWICAWDGPPHAPAPSPLVLLATEPPVAKWMALGDGHSALGWPVSEVEALREGTILRLARGSILAHPTHGAVAIAGTLFAFWRSLGGEGSDLGWPLEDARVPADPRMPHAQPFEHGTLSWSAERGAWREV